MTTIDTTMTGTSDTTMGTRVRRAFGDAWTIARRDLLHWRMQPAVTVFGWLFPVMIMLMFAGLFGGAIGGTEGQSYIDFLLPGMFAMSMLFGVEATMTAVATDAGKGVTDRFRSMPIGGVAVVGGRATADMIGTVVALAVLVGAGLLLGWRADGGVGAAAAAFALLLLLRFAYLWIGIYVGLFAKGPESIVAIQVLVWPIGFLSNAFVDTTSMPSWLGAIAEWNPMSATATAARELFGAPGWPGSTWVADNAMLMAVVWPVVLTAIFMPLAARKFRTLSR